MERYTQRVLPEIAERSRHLRRSESGAETNRTRTGSTEVSLEGQNLRYRTGSTGPKIVWVLWGTLLLFFIFWCQMSTEPRTMVSPILNVLYFCESASWVKSVRGRGFKSPRRSDGPELILDSNQTFQGRNIHIFMGWQKLDADLVKVFLFHVFLGWLFWKTD